MSGHAEASAHFPSLGNGEWIPIPDAVADKILGPPREGYVPVSVPMPDGESPPRTPESLNSLKREAIIALKELGKIQQGKAVDYQWAFWAAQRIAQAKLDIHDFAIDECRDEKVVCGVYNEIIRQLRLAQEKAEEARAEPPFRRHRPPGVAAPT